MPWIETRTGLAFDFSNPTIDMIQIEDIAAALSKLCRFTGHTSKFYSVAEHSVHVSFITPPEDAMWGLLHDASEAYTGDMNRPLKMVSPEFRKVENQIQHLVSVKFGLSEPEPASVKKADNIMLITERDALFDSALKWSPDLENLPRYAGGLWFSTPEQGERIFLDRFSTLEREYRLGLR